METLYPYTLTPRDEEQLYAEIAALALPGFLSVVGSGNSTVKIVFSAALANGQKTTLDSTVAAHVPNPNNAINRLRAAADAYFAAQNDQAQLVARAIILTALDEINTLRQWIMSFKAATAAATSLANLQTRVAALNNLPDRTPAQAKSAVTSKIDAGGAD